MANMLPRGAKGIIESVNPEIIHWLGDGVVIARHDAAPSDGETGTLAGEAGPGSLLLVTTGNAYVNTGTIDAPTWTAVTGG